MKRALVLLALAACGPTVGDPCTTPADCLDQACFNGAAFPGGYCSTKTCTVGDDTSCPSGSVCVSNGPNAACYRTCKTMNDCRGNYVCESQNGSSHPICIGPKGL
jgi:hypothetical protein